MKPGDKLPIILEVIKPVEYGDNWNGQKLENLRGNLFWAAPKGCEGAAIVVCSDLETEKNIIERKAIVDLLECGVGC